MEGPLALMKAKAWKSFVSLNSLLTSLSYPVGMIFVVGNHWPSNIENARFFWQMILGTWLPVSAGITYAVCKSKQNTAVKVASRVAAFYIWDIGMLTFALCSRCVEKVLKKETGKNRLFHCDQGQEKFHGSRIVVLGNGPSLAKGDPLGAAIDSMDEVIRFNNFQTKISGLEEWTGKKTTVHFSDSMLYPSYEEYKVPGATVCLSLFMDRLMVSGSYFLFRIGVDLAFKEAIDMMFDAETGWINAEDILKMKTLLGLRKSKHPTSGCLAIDWFSRHRPDEKTPIYIHGFDFFQGDQIHYYSKTEPLYERINDLVGVNVMHEPHKERAFVEGLVAKGHVKWLRDAVANGDFGPEVRSAVAAAAARVSAASSS